MQLVPGAQILWAAQKRAQSGGGEGGGGSLKFWRVRECLKYFKPPKNVVLYKRITQGLGHIHVHVVVNFLSQLIFIFSLFWSMVM